MGSSTWTLTMVRFTMVMFDHGSVDNGCVDSCVDSCVDNGNGALDHDIDHSHINVKPTSHPVRQYIPLIDVV